VNHTDDAEAIWYPARQSNNAAAMAIPASLPDAAAAIPESIEAGRKLDAGKMDWTLVPWDALEPIVRVLEFGAKKYERDNWLHVPGSTRRYTAALLRHVIAYASGEEKDSETGESHLAHAGCCLLFLLSQRRTKP
jgi:hypothetical protein